MAQPKSSRPYMPGYGIPNDHQGLLPWSFAEERLANSHDYWLATVWPDGRPHVMPVWGAWLEDHLWFSTDQSSRKARNLALQPRCVIATDNALEPVVADGVAALVTDRSQVVRFTDTVRTKYASEWLEDVYTVDFFDANLGGGGTYRLTP
ncbi:MAG: pyridoxamine 5'-phosphate oxidase family protein, partial [Acidimicrobiaceae bacterium]|nr:pyridoxamine 5'-phosphate oxidase family protein [Acidimicrobiaceae bacterium]